MVMAMEDVLRSRVDHGGVVKDKNRGDSSLNEEDSKTEIAVKVGNKRKKHGNDDTKPTSPTEKDSSCDKQAFEVTNNLERSSLMEPDSTEKKQDDHKLESARTEMGEVREENQRLKMYLNRIMKDYQTLQMQFFDIVQQESTKPIDISKDHNPKEMDEEPDQLVSLSLGRFPSDSSRKDVEKNNKSTPSQGTNNNIDEDDHEHRNKTSEGLSLGLDCKFEISSSSKSDHPNDQAMPNNLSPANSLEEAKEEAGQTWPPSKALKSIMKSSGDDTNEISQQNPAKKARVSVRTRCDTPTMNDGCQWRKYGQKIAKGNPCPRAYYRCTVAPSCPVRKQVQRCAEDMSILITTYEGTHNHPLPVSATAMASTTSAAASMLLSGSSSSTNGQPASTSGVTSLNLHGLNFYLSDTTKSKQFYLHNSSLSPSPTCPTITLDLTSTPPSSSLSSSPFNRIFSSNYPPRYDQTSISFGSSQSNSLMSWANPNRILSYGTQQQPHVKNQIGTSLNLGRQQMENIYQSYMQKNNLSAIPQTQSNLPADTIAAATKAITADPSFQSALAAALTSIIGNNNNTSGASQITGDNFGQRLMKLGTETLQVASSTAYSSSPTSKGNNGCASSAYLMNKSPSSPTSSNHQPGSLMFLPPNSLPFSTSKSASASPGDNREHSN